MGSWFFYILPVANLVFVDIIVFGNQMVVS